MPTTFFDINHIAFEGLGYSVSYVELIGTLFGFVSVFFASRANILTWSTGIFNEFCLFLLFFQVQLYADMLLQIFFFIVTLYGWRNWKTTTTARGITVTSLFVRTWILGAMLLSTLALGYAISQIHLYLPIFFKTPSSYPFTDSLVMVLSIVATLLLAKKKIETWYLWILVDLICVFLFFEKGIAFLAVEYLLFLGLAMYGLANWRKQIQHA